MKVVQTFHGAAPIAVKSIYAHNDDASDILCIHMSWGGAWTFKFYLKLFSNHGYNCHAVDLRGHGNSGGRVEGATMQDYVEDVRSCVVGINLKNPIVIGHSMGGLIALMYSSQFGSSATISLDGSPPIEVQLISAKKQYPRSYTAYNAGMPRNPIKVMYALSDIPIIRLIKMKFSLGKESGIARSNRKLGISIPKELLKQPLLFIGAENGTSLPFGIGIEKASKQARYYNAPIIEIKGASHPGLLIGKHWKQTSIAILEWLKESNLS